MQFLKILGIISFCMPALSAAKGEDAKPPGDILSGISIFDAKYVIHKDQIQKVTLSFSVTNKSGVVLKDLFFHGRLQTAGRALPWFEADLNYTVPGGIENDETRKFNLIPSIFSDWEKVDPDAAKTATLFVTVKAVVDAKGNRIGEQ